jgi:hypothetical protein
MSEESYLKDDDLEPIDATVKGSTRRQMGKHILHMWEEGTKHREEETRSLIDTIGRTRVEQEADKA